MSIYAEVNGSTLLQYPFNFYTLQKDNPYTNYGNNYDFLYWYPLTSAATEYGNSLVEVIQLPPPEHNPYTQNINPAETPIFVDGNWVVEWIVTEKTPQEKIEYVQSVKNSNKTEAENLLTTSDWTAIPSVADPAQSNPYLMNQSAFLFYRSQVREIAVNPPDTYVTSWPTLPTEQWSS